MLTRCRNPKATGYDRYGGRGIRVCPRWELFENFIADMGPRPSPSHSIERIDNDGDYTPENCRWASQVAQAGNKRNNHPISFDGFTAPVAQWSRATGIHVQTILTRLRSGWSVERALTVGDGRAHSTRLHGSDGRFFKEKEGNE